MTGFREISGGGRSGLAVVCLVGLLSGLLSVLTGCANLPDLELAKRDLQGGQEQAAVAQLQRLAEFGLPTAQVLLGDYYFNESLNINLNKRFTPRRTANRDGLTLPPWKRAEQWYQAAADDHEVRAYSRLGRLYRHRLDVQPNDDHANMVAAAKRYFTLALENGDASGIADLVELYFDETPIVNVEGAVSDEGGLNDEREQALRLPVLALIRQSQARGYLEANYALVRYYALTGQAEARREERIQRCRLALAVAPACFMELAQIYQEQPALGDVETLVNAMQTQWRDGRLSANALWKMAFWLVDPERSTPRPQAAIQLLKHIERDEPRALYGQGKVMARFPSLGTPAELVAVLQRGCDAGFAESHLLLGRIYYYGKRVPLDPVLAEQHLLAASTEIPAAHYFLGQIYRKGYLGKHDPHKAVAHFLQAARAGSVKADYALAAYFWENRGIRRKPEYAYAFARLALTEGHPRAEQLLTAIQRDSEPFVPELGETIAQRERSVRQDALLADALSQHE
ncbi:MAG: hypothetical protein P8144_00560 [Gammaproteobacteria bacterium]